MRALYTFGADVPFARIVGEHRRWLVPVGLLLAINLVVLVAVVLPLRQSVASGSARAEDSGRALAAASAELKQAEALRDGQTQAARDLDEFYAEVLPGDFITARRVTHIKLAQLARAHDVTFISGAASTEELRDSKLERLHVNYALSGDWDDIRQFIYEVETGADFVVIDNLALAQAEADGALSLTLDLSTYYRAGNAR
ncbi:MAG TPA: GspMb/PilO family protein [Vicinamibacterales bacterium]|nr:GspMb/PilO family protein [Vicinamibacterales bacterium]